MNKFGNVLLSFTPDLDVVSRHGSGIHHRDTVFDPEAQTRREYTEDSIISLAGRRRLGNNAIAFGEWHLVQACLPDVALR